MVNTLKVMKGTMDSCLTNHFRLLYAARAYLNTRKRGKYINPVDRSHFQSGRKYFDIITLILRHVIPIKETDAGEVKIAKSIQQKNLVINFSCNNQSNRVGKSTTNNNDTTTSNTGTLTQR